MADKGRGGGQKPEKKAKPRLPPRNFVTEWKTEEGGVAHGYLIAELVVYFPKIVVTDGQPKMSEDIAVRGGGQGEAQTNVADPAFAELFAHPLNKRVILKATALPDGGVSGGSFRVEMTSMSGDPFYQD